MAAPVTHSAFDDEDKLDRHPVPDHVVLPDRSVTRSRFDDEDKVDRHPTGR